MNVRQTLRFSAALLCACFCTLAISGCPWPGPDCGLADCRDVVSGIGTLRFLPIEGGCFQLEAENGVHYEVGIEDDELRQAAEMAEDGVRVRFEGALLPEMASTCMVGQPLLLDFIERI